MAKSRVQMHRPPNTRAPRNKKLSKDFNELEFRCKCNGAYCDGMLPDGMDDMLITWLQEIRTAAGFPVVVLSTGGGYRCPQFNKNANGTPRSFHKRGMAADIWIKGLSTAATEKHATAALERLQEADERFKGVNAGIGVYTRRKFIHLDVGKRKWRERK